MSSVCPTCSNVYDPTGRCPRCGPGWGECGRGLPADSNPGNRSRWQQTFWGRVVIGLILSQGLFYGLRHLLTGILLATSGSEPDDLWEPLPHLLLLQAVQLLALFVGGLMAGGGQQQGFVLGILVGAWNGVLAVMLRQNPAQELTMVALYGQPLLHATFGAFGGWAGSWVWKPIPVAVPFLFSPQRKVAPRRKTPLLAGRVFWFRVLTGAAFAIVGTLCATMIFQKVIVASAGHLATSHEMQDRIITWEIKALALLVGGALAGAATPNGLKQGLFVALVSCVVLVGIQAPKTEAWDEVAFWTAISTFSLATAGGWFGGQLFPPVVKLNRRGVNAYT